MGGTVREDGGPQAGDALEAGADGNEVTGG